MDELTELSRLTKETFRPLGGRLTRSKTVLQRISTPPQYNEMSDNVLVSLQVLLEVVTNNYGNLLGTPEFKPFMVAATKELAFLTDKVARIKSVLYDNIGKMKFNRGNYVHFQQIITNSNNEEQAILGKILSDIDSAINVRSKKLRIKRKNNVSLKNISNSYFRIKTLQNAATRRRQQLNQGAVNLEFNQLQENFEGGIRNANELQRGQQENNRRAEQARRENSRRSEQARQERVRASNEQRQRREQALQEERERENEARQRALIDTQRNEFRRLESSIRSVQQNLGGPVPNQGPQPGPQPGIFNNLNNNSPLELPPPRRSYRNALRNSPQ